MRKQRKTISGKDRVKQRLKARFLIVAKGYCQTEAAKEVGVSNKTVCLWFNRYNWGEALDKEAAAKGGMSIYFNKFLLYVRSTDPAIYKRVNDLWDAFINKTEKQLNMDD